MLTFLHQTDLFEWVILPFLIFIARVFDVSIGTIRIIFISKGNKILSPLLGFFESLIWLIAISQIMQNLDNILSYIAYAAGFAFGNYVGIIVEEKIALGVYVVRIFTFKCDTKLKQRLIEEGFGVTEIEGKGANTDVKIIYSIIKRKNLNGIVSIINECNDKTFYSIEDARSVNKGIFPNNSSKPNLSNVPLDFNLPRAFRKRK